MKGCFGFIGMNHSCPFPCPPGQYSLPTVTNGYCYATPGGYYSLGTGATTYPGYVTCPSGQYAPSPYTPCQVAPVGSYATSGYEYPCYTGTYTSSSK